VTSVEPIRIRPRGRFRRLTALVGRGELLKKAEQQISSWLKQSYDPATYDITTGAAQVKGRNRLLVIGGAAAVGKSRFAYELVERMKAESPINTAYAHCVENASLSAFAAEVAGVAGLTEGNLQVRWEELCSHAASAISEAYAERQRKHLPLLALLLDCEEVDTAGIRQADTASFLLGVKLALRACCELIAHHTGQPVVLVIEDLQWMGNLREVIADLLENACLPQPLIGIGTARPEFAATDEELAELTGIGESGLSAGLRPFSVMVLPPLERTEGGRLVQKLLPGIKLPGQVERELAQKAEGLPYYYEEFARLLLRRGLVVEREGRFVVKEGVSEVELPKDIRALLLDRLNGLEPELRELTGRAAVIGRSFSRKRLQKVQEKLGAGTAERLESGLANLAEQQVLGGEPGDQYFFEHVMSRNAAYDSVPNPDRQLLHGVMSDVLGEMLVPGTASEWDILPELTKHLEAEGRQKEAHEKCCELLTLMAATGRYEQWEYWAEKARYAWEHARSTAPALPEKSASILRATGLRHGNQGRYQEAQELYHESLQVSREIGDRRGIAKALNNMGMVAWGQGSYEKEEKLFRESLETNREIGDRRGTAASLDNLGNVAFRQRRYESAEKLHRESFKIYREIGNRKGIAGSLHNLGNVAEHQGRYEEAEELTREALEINQEIGNRSWISNNLNNLGTIAKRMGRHEEAEKLYQEALRLRHEIGDRHGIAEALNNLGREAHERGHFDKATELYRQGLQIFREVGDRYGIALALSNLGEVARNQGSYEKAEKLFHEYSQISRQIGDREAIAQSLSYLGAVANCQGRYEEAEKLHEDSLAMRREIHYPFGIAESLGCLGDAAYGQGRYEEALKFHQESLRIWREIGFHAKICESLTKLGAVSMKLGRVVEARKHLEEALRISSEVGAPPMIIEQLITTGYFLGQTNRLKESAILLAGAEYHAERIGSSLAPTEQCEFDQAMKKLEKEFPIEELEELKAQAEKMSLEELTEFALKALESLTPEELSGIERDSENW